MYISVHDKAPETTARNAEARKIAVKQSSAQTLKQPAGNALKTLLSAHQKEAMRSAGLPADKLSASILSFARFFSLPLKPEILKHIRQQAFTMTPNAVPSGDSEDGSPPERTVLRYRSALSLAVSSAEGKGVELQTKGLETYVKALDPESRRDGEQDNRRGQRKKNDDENDSEASSRKTSVISAASLEKTALELAEKNPLLAILNRLPGKDGKRWVVLPFDFCDNGREYKVSLRILLETGKTVNRADCMALDIAVCGSTKRQLFVFEPANRLSVFIQPEITPDQQAVLVRELSALLEIAPERIFIKTKTESFPFEAECGDGLFDSIDEAV